MARAPAVESSRLSDRGRPVAVVEIFRDRSFVRSTGGQKLALTCGRFLAVRAQISHATIGSGSARLIGQQILHRSQRRPRDCGLRLNRPARSTKLFISSAAPVVRWCGVNPGRGEM